MGGWGTVFLLEMSVEISPFSFQPSPSQLLKLSAKILPEWKVFCNTAIKNACFVDFGTLVHCSVTLRVQLQQT